MSPALRAASSCSCWKACILHGRKKPRSALAGRCFASKILAGDAHRVWDSLGKPRAAAVRVEASGPSAA